MKNHRPAQSLGLLMATALAVASVPAFGDDGEHHDHHRRNPRPSSQRNHKAAVTSSAGLAQYESECGSCHLAYPPGMLPARSWALLLDGLSDHFGQNAELDTKAQSDLRQWLLANAAESGSHPLSRRALKSSRDATPIRLSELRFIAHEHAEVRASAFTSPSVSSVANCGACHRGAEEWRFKEREIRIPN